LNAFPPEQPQLELGRLERYGSGHLRVVTPTFHPEPIGTPHYALQLVRWVRSQGWTVDVVTANPYYPRFELYEGYDGGWRTEVLDDGITVRRLRTLVPKEGRSSWRAASDVNYVAQAVTARVSRRIRPAPLTLAISPGTPLVVAAARALTARRGRVLCWVHDLQGGVARALGSSPALGRAIDRSEARLVASADEVFTLSEGMAAGLRAAGVTKPIDVLPLWATLPPDDGTVVERRADVQYSGNLGRKQGCDQLLDLAERLHAARPGTTLLIRADALARRPLEAEAAARGVGNVCFEDLAPHDRLRHALREATVHVAPQRPGVGDSVVPSKVVNALAAGCHVVAASEPGTELVHMAARTELLTITPPGDVAAMTGAVLRLLERSRQGSLG
jgi:colanic acid biosynthesis glycosyl transferase WcaI